VLRIFIALKNSVASAGLNPRTLGKHTNHYTTEATMKIHIHMRFNFKCFLTFAPTCIKKTILDKVATTVRVLGEWLTS
jgi:hypothetical protein